MGAEQLWSEFNNHRQGVDLEQAETVAGRLVRYTVHHDTFVGPQSHAKAEVWRPSDLSWQPLATFHFDRWAHMRDVGPQRAVDGLRAKALMVLEHGS